MPQSHSSSYSNDKPIEGEVSEATLPDSRARGFAGEAKRDLPHTCAPRRPGRPDHSSSSEIYGGRTCDLQKYPWRPTVRVALQPIDRLPYENENLSEDWVSIHSTAQHETNAGQDAAFSKTARLR